MGSHRPLGRPGTGTLRDRCQAGSLDGRFGLRAFNALSHSNWDTPKRFVNTPHFATITEPSTPGREFQMSARLSF